MLLRCSPRDTLSSALITRGSCYETAKHLIYAAPNLLDKRGLVFYEWTNSQSPRLQPVGGSMEHEDASWISFPPFFRIRG
jgi:hypothetical protein